MAKKDQNVTENLPQVEVTDSTTTKGVKTKPQVSGSQEDLKKTQVFQSLRKKLLETFDLNLFLAKCISQGITDFETAINEEKQRIKEASNKEMSFTEFVDLLKSQSEYNDLLNVLCVSSFEENNYSLKGSPIIYHSNQTDNEEKTYNVDTIKVGDNEVKIFWETKLPTLENWLQSIRYFSVRSTAIQSVINKEMKSIKDQINKLIGGSIVKNGSKKTLELLKSVLC